MMLNDNIMRPGDQWRNAVKATLVPELRAPNQNKVPT